MTTGIEQLKVELGTSPSPRTVQSYTWAARCFLDQVGDKLEYTAEEYKNYLDSLAAAGCSQARIDLAWYALTKLHRAKVKALMQKVPGLPRERLLFPLEGGRFGDKPKSKVRKVAQEIVVEDEHREVTGPTPSYNEVVALINWARDHGTARQKAFLALSTVYVMRAIEISRVNKRKHIKGDRIWIDTAKGGVAGWHHIPDEVFTAITSYNYPEMSEQVVWAAFKKMRRDAGLPSVLTPHGIRRWVDTWFTSTGAVPRDVWWDFARWSARDMPGRYRHASTSSLDRDVFAKHPLLPVWRGAIETLKEEV